jgi:hypothetical protein
MLWLRRSQREVRFRVPLEVVASSKQVILCESLMMRSPSGARATAT